MRSYLVFLFLLLVHQSQADDKVPLLESVRTGGEGASENANSSNLLPISESRNESEGALSIKKEKVEQFFGPKDGLDPCHLKSYYEKIKSLSISRIDMTGLDDPNKLEELIHRSFETRKQLLVNSADHPNCYSQVRDYSRALRYLEDYMVEIWVAKKNIKSYKTFSGEGPFFLKSPGFKLPQCGDIIISRGSAAASAAIAQVGDTASNFSHLSFVSEDSQGKLETAEAHIEVGSIVRPLEKHISDGNARTMVLRFQNKELQGLSCAASKCVADEIKAYQTGPLRSAANPNIPYNFSMDPKKKDSLFCSQVAQRGFQCVYEKNHCGSEESEICDLIQENGLKDGMPLRTTFPSGLNQMLEQLGIKNSKNFKTISPGDLEGDPRFMIMAEGRDFTKTKGLRTKDIAIDTIFAKVGSGAELNPSSRVNFDAAAGSILANHPYLKKVAQVLARTKYPNMNQDQIKAIKTLEYAAAALESKVASIQDANPNRPLSVAEVQVLMSKCVNDEPVQSFFK